MKVSRNSNTVLIPIGCSLWVKETDDTPMENIDTIRKTGMKRLGNVRIRQQHVLGGIVETEECDIEGLNSGSHNLRGTDYWCRTVFLHFGAGNSFPSGCSCYVRS